MARPVTLFTGQWADLSFEDLAAQVTAHQPGDTVEVVVVRDGEEVTLTATLGTRPPAEG